MAARQRWAILRASLLGSSQEIQSVSVRAHSGPELFAWHAEKRAELTGRELQGVMTPKFPCGPEEEMDIAVVLPRQEVGVRGFQGEYTGFLNTGNVCIWPAEQVLAYFCARNRTLLENKSVCELGAGATGFAGIFAAAVASPGRVLITDGNPNSVEFLQRNIDSNRSRLRISMPIQSAQFMWGTSTASEWRKSFDVVLAADCTFYRELHLSLLASIDALLKDSGIAVVVSPERGGSMGEFLERASELGYLVEQHLERQDLMLQQFYERDQEHPNFRADIHASQICIIRRSSR